MLHSPAASAALVSTQLSGVAAIQLAPPAPMLALPAPQAMLLQPAVTGATSASATSASVAEAAIAAAVCAMLDGRLRPRSGCAKCMAGLADQNLLKTYNTAVKMSKSVDASHKPACALFSHAVAEDTLVKMVIASNPNLESLGLLPSKLPGAVKAAVRKFMQDKFGTCLLGTEVTSGKTTRNPVNLYAPDIETSRLKPVDKNGVFKDAKHYDVYMGLELLPVGGAVEEPFEAGVMEDLDD